MRLLRELALGVFLTLSGSPLSRGETLNLDRALSRARERAPTVLVARARIEEARARLKGASLLLRENPEVDAAAGRPASGDAKLEFGLIQNVELGGRRSARIQMAGAEVASSVAEAENTLREALRDVRVSFFRALLAQNRVSLSLRAEDIASDVYLIAKRRHEAGDVALLDVNLAAAAAARARAETRAARADHAGGVGELRVLLGLLPDQEFTLEGDLRESHQYDLPALLASAANRGDIGALRAELDAANAEVRLGRALGWPEFGLGGRYEREEGQSVFLGAVRFTIPAFDHGQGIRAEANARARRLQLQINESLRAVQSDVRTAYETYAQQKAAADELERNALALLDENESLSRESYEAGEISLAELLLVRREVLEIRKEYLSLLLEVATAAAQLEASAGVLR